MNIRWTENAVTCPERISDCIADNAESALQIVTARFERIEELAIFPNRGRIEREPGTRELVLWPLPCFVAYRVHALTV